MIRTRRRRAQPSHAPAVSLTPLIDTALTLLVVFMVAAPVAHQSIHVDLPKGSSAEANSKQKNNEIVISIDRTGALFVNKKAVQRTKIADLIRELIANGKSSTVYLSVDKQAAAGAAIELLAELRGIDGVETVAFDVDSHGPSA